jgi:hypothetical protein
MVMKYLLPPIVGRYQTKKKPTEPTKTTTIVLVQSFVSMFFLINLFKSTLRLVLPSPFFFVVVVVVPFRLSTFSHDADDARLAASSLSLSLTLLFVVQHSIRRANISLVHTKPYHIMIFA